MTQRDTIPDGSIELALESVGAEIVPKPSSGLESIAGPATGSRAPGPRPEQSEQVELDLVLSEDGAVTFDVPTPPRARAAGLEAVAPAEPPDTRRHRVRFADLPGNTITEAIAGLDIRRTPNQGLRVLTPSGLLAPVTERRAGRTLLIVHGTFSNSESVLAEIAQGDPAFLGWAMSHYAQVLTFDYPTMSRQALANAMTLRRLLAPFSAQAIDVVSHSQGGLVTRYWLEMMEPHRLGESRAIFVGGTLAGTSLAAPPALRQSLSLLASVARKLGAGAELASGVIPLFGYVAGVFSILEKTVGFLSRAPIFDAGVALIPGFAGMSRVGNNAELDELRCAVRSVPPGYFAVRCDFEPDPLGWKFWRRFISRVADGAADRLFNAPNDLVVDTTCHTELSDAHSIGEDDPSRVLGYDLPNPDVFHTTYFAQPATMSFLRRALAL